MIIIVFRVLCYANIFFVLCSMLLNFCIHYLYILINISVQYNIKNNNFACVHRKEVLKLLVEEHSYPSVYHIDLVEIRFKLNDYFDMITTS